jgi:thiamine biosynthesis lipoprotein
MTVSQCAVADHLIACASVSKGLQSARFRAMGCEMNLWLVADTPTAAVQLAAARAFIEATEAHLSRFRPESELSRLNARSGEPVVVSPLLYQVVEVALGGSRRTYGLYDPTVITALEAAGYERSFASVLDTEAPPRLVSLPLAGWRDIRLDQKRRSIILPRGLRLDLGGVAKAWTADRVADQLAPYGPCLVDAGGDIALRGALPRVTGWPIGVADPRRPDTDLACLLLRDHAVVTSGVDHRRWQRGGCLQHHIIDPRTHRPADTDLLAVTIVAADAAVANVHAVATLVLGAQAGLVYLRKQEGVEGLLVCRNGELLPTPGFARCVYSWGA